MVAAIILLGGIWMWMKIVAPESVVGAFIVAQLILLLLLIPRFWQRGVVVSYWQQKMMVPVAQVFPLEPQPVSVAVVPEPAPVAPNAPPATQGY
jgi:uncharacterized membrane protein